MQPPETIGALAIQVLVRNAAASLLADRFILKEDYDAYIQAAPWWR